MQVIPVTKVVESVNSELVCKLCNNLLSNPVAVNCQNEHVFCARCTPEFLTNCPECNEKITVTKPAKFISRLLSEIAIYCPAGEPCQWTGLVKELEYHENKCSSLWLLCDDPIYSGCKRVVNKYKWSEHINACEFRRFPCPNAPRCGHYITFSEQEEHAKECTDFMCGVSQLNCYFTGKREVVEQVQPFCKQISSSLSCALEDLTKKYEEKCLQVIELRQQLAERDEPVITDEGSSFGSVSIPDENINQEICPEQEILVEQDLEEISFETRNRTIELYERYMVEPEFDLEDYIPEMEGAIEEEKYFQNCRGKGKYCGRKSPNSNIMKVKIGGVGMKTGDCNNQSTHATVKDWNKLQARRRGKFHKRQAQEKPQLYVY